MSKLAHSNQETMNQIETEARQREEVGFPQDPPNRMDAVLDDAYWKTERLVNLGHRLTAGELLESKLTAAGYKLMPVQETRTVKTA